MRTNLMSAAMGMVAAAAFLSACSSAGATVASGTGDRTTALPAGGSSSAAGAGSATHTVKVRATDYKLALDTTSFAPGSYTFQMADDGHATHAIEISGPGVTGTTSDAVGPGGTASLTVTLQKGTYQLWCPVGNHRALGMQTTLTVG